MNKLTKKLGGQIASLAIKVTALNANSTCYWLNHQPKLPKGAEKLKKI